MPSGRVRAGACGWRRSCLPVALEEERSGASLRLLACDLQCGAVYVSRDGRLLLELDGTCIGLSAVAFCGLCRECHDALCWASARGANIKPIVLDCGHLWLTLPLSDVARLARMMAAAADDVGLLVAADCGLPGWKDRAASTTVDRRPGTALGGG
jgi:hypothetical protein